MQDKECDLQHQLYVWKFLIDSFPVASGLKYNSRAASYSFSHMGSSKPGNK